MKIAYFGNDIFLDCFRPLVNAKPYRLLKLFASVIYDEQGYDITRNIRCLARNSGIPVQASQPLPKDLESLQQQGCEMIISAGYGYKIPPWCGGAIKYAINIHPSLLPRGAGPMPLPWVILKGLQQTGVTIHKLTNKWDAGDILLQESFPLTGSENMEALLGMSQRLATELLERFLKTPATYWEQATPQLLRDREYWPKLTPSDVNIDWNWTLDKIGQYLRIHRYVRVDGVVEYITDVALSRTRHSFVPGEVVFADGEQCKLAAKDGIISFRVRRGSTTC